MFVWNGSAAHRSHRERSENWLCNRWWELRDISAYVFHVCYYLFTQWMCVSWWCSGCATMKFNSIVMRAHTGKRRLKTMPTYRQGGRRLRCDWKRRDGFIIYRFVFTRRANIHGELRRCTVRRTNTLHLQAALCAPETCVQRSSLSMAEFMNEFLIFEFYDMIFFVIDFRRTVAWSYRTRNETLNKRHEWITNSEIHNFHLIYWQVAKYFRYYLIADCSMLSRSPVSGGTWHASESVNEIYEYQSYLCFAQIFSNQKIIRKNAGVDHFGIVYLATEMNCSIEIAYRLWSIRRSMIEEIKQFTCLLTST